MSADAYFQVQQWLFFLIFVLHVDDSTPFSFLELAVSRLSKKEIVTYMFQEEKKKKVIRKPQCLRP